MIPAGPEACAFPIQVHSQGLIHDFLYDDGTLKRILQQLEGVIFAAGQHSETLFPNVCEALA